MYSHPDSPHHPQVEIDEYRDYEKAVGALREALAHVGKARTDPKGPAKAEQLQASLGSVVAVVLIVV
jgi:hypothetical protein